MEARHILPAAGRTPEELRQAALFMATLVMEDPDLDDERSQIEDLSLVLEVLGYRTKFPFGSVDFRTDAYGRVDRHHRANVKPREATRKKRRYEQGETETTAVPVQTPIRGQVRRHSLLPVCGSDRGTMRGYTRHITAYNTPCSDCAAARARQLEERWERLGLPEHAREGVIQ